MYEMKTHIFESLTYKFKSNIEFKQKQKQKNIQIHREFQWNVAKFIYQVQLAISVALISAGAGHGLFTPRDGLVTFWTGIRKRAFSRTKLQVKTFAP